MATREDAALIVQLMRWGTEMGLQDAARVILSGDFEPDSASALDPAVQAVLTHGEVIATLVKHDALDRDLIADLFAFGSMWARLGPAALRARDAIGEPRLFENFEALAVAPADH